MWIGIIAITAIITEMITKNKKIELQRLEREIELEKLRLETFDKETEKMRIELEQSKQALLEHLSSSSIFSCITHGLSNAIAVTGEESLCINDINSLHSTAFDNLDFVYLGACFTGAGKNDSNNLVNAFYNKGATAVLGFSVKTIVAQTNLWTSYFMEELSKGKTVTEAAVVADARISVNPKFADVVSFSTQPDNRYYVGPESYAPCLPF